MKKYYSSGSLSDINNVYGYSVSQTMVPVLKACRRQPDARERDEAGRQSSTI